MKYPYDTRIAMAEAAGVFRQTLGQWMKQDNFPIAREPLWSDTDVEMLAAFRMWLSEDPSNGNRKKPPFSLAGVRTARLQAERIQSLRFERELKAKQYLKVSDVRTEFETYCTLVRDSLMRLPRRLTPRLNTVDTEMIEAEIRRILTETSKKLMMVIEGETDADGVH